MFASQPGRRARSRVAEKNRTASPAPRAQRRKVRLALVRQPELPAERGGMPPRIARFLESADLPSPCLVVDVDLVEHNYRQLAGSLAGARLFYAVKANPAIEIVGRLVELDACFDTASLGEIDLCLGLGATAERISYATPSRNSRT